MGLAAPGYVEHRLSMHLCLVGQRQLGHTHWHQSPHIQTMFSETFTFFLVPGMGKFVIDLIQMWPVVHGHTIWVVDSKRSMWYPWCQVSVVVKLRVFHLCLWCHRSNGSWHGHCGGAAAVQGLVQKCSISIALAMEILQSCTKPWIYC